MSSGVLPLLRPLLQDPIATVQLTAAVCVGRIATFSEGFVEDVLDQGLLNQIVDHLNQDNKHFKKTACFVFRCIAKHGERQAQAVVDAGALPGLVSALKILDSSVKEAACWALGFIARHSSSLAETMVSCGALALLVLCSKEPEMTLRRIAVSTLSDTVKHTELLARNLVELEVLPQLVSDLDNSDSGLRRQVTSCLYQIAKHSPDLADGLARLDAIPKAIGLLRDTSEPVRKNACMLLREISKHNESLATQLVMAGGIVGITEYLKDNENRLAAIMTLGYIASVSETLGMAVVSAGSVPLVDSTLLNDPDEHVKNACVWCFSQIGKHSAEHAKSVVQALPKIIAVSIHPDASDELKDKAKNSFKSIIANVNDLAKLEPLILESPRTFLKYIIRQLAKVLFNNTEGRKHFVTAGHLQQILQMTRNEDDEKILQAVNELKSIYPNEVVSYFSPDFSEELIKKLDEFTPVNQSS